MSSESNAIDYDSVQINFGKSKQAIDIGEFNANRHGRAHQLEGIKHKGFAFLDLSKVNTKSSNFLNVQIRSEQHSDEAVSEMQDSLKEEWSFNYPLPVVEAETGKILDGRTRTMAAIKNGEQFIPVEIVSEAPDESTFIANAIKSNCSHTPARPANRSDFVNGYIRAWDYGNGKVGETSEDIKSWLLDAGIAERWDPENPSLKQQHTKTLNEISMRLKHLKHRKNPNGGEYLVVKDKEEAELIAKNSLPLDINHVVLSASYSGDVARDWYSTVVKHVKEVNEEKAFGKISIVLFCKSFVEAHKYDLLIKEYIQKFHQVHDDAFMIAEATEEDMRYHLQLKRRPYRFIGVIPQVHGRDSHMNGDDLNVSDIIYFDKNAVDSDSLFS